MTCRVPRRLLGLGLLDRVLDKVLGQDPESRGGILALGGDEWGELLLLKVLQALVERVGDWRGRRRGHRHGLDRRERLLASATTLPIPAALVSA